MSNAIQNIKRINYNKAQSLVAALLTDQILEKLYTVAFKHNEYKNTGRPKKERKEMPTLKVFLRWARGTGKSTIFALYIRHCVELMPRSIGVIVAETYTQILTRTLSSTILGLEMQGYIKDVHFFVGRRAPETAGFPEAYMPPTDYKHCIHFYNGTTIVMVSQDKIGDGRGLNVDWLLGDEAALLDFERLQTDIFPTLRGSFRKMYKNCRLHRSMLFASSTPLTDKGQWFLDMEKKHNPKELTFCFAAKSSDNEHLPKGWIDEQRELLEEWVFDAEIENIPPSKIKGGFYPEFVQAKHVYSSPHIGDISLNTVLNSTNDKDCNPNEPLILGIDWGVNINCIVVAQRNQKELRIINAIYSESPKILDDAIEEFAEYYKNHQRKYVIMYYDNSGNVRQANSSFTYAQQAQNILIKNKFIVDLKSRGTTNEVHDTKHKLINSILREDNPAWPIVRINKRCMPLIIAIERCKAKKSITGLIQKDKAPEKRRGSQLYAPHFTDAFDVIPVGLYSNLNFLGQTPIMNQLR